MKVYETKLLGLKTTYDFMFTKFSWGLNCSNFRKKTNAGLYQKDFTEKELGGGEFLVVIQYNPICISLYSSRSYRWIVSTQRSKAFKTISKE